MQDSSRLPCLYSQLSVFNRRKWAKSAKIAESKVKSTQFNRRSGKIKENWRNSRKIDEIKQKSLKNNENKLNFFSKISWIHGNQWKSPEFAKFKPSSIKLLKFPSIDTWTKPQPNESSFRVYFHRRISLFKSHSSAQIAKPRLCELATNVIANHGTENQFKTIVTQRKWENIAKKNKSLSHFTPTAT